MGYARTDVRTDARTKAIFLVNAFKAPALRAGQNKIHYGLIWYIYPSTQRDLPLCRNDTASLSRDDDKKMLSESKR